MFFSGLVILDQSQCTCVKDIDFTLSYHKADSIKLKLGNPTSGSYKFVLITLKFQLISLLYITPNPHLCKSLQFVKYWKFSMMLVLQFC